MDADIFFFLPTRLLIFEFFDDADKLCWASASYKLADGCPILPILACRKRQKVTRSSSCPYRSRHLIRATGTPRARGKKTNIYVHSPTIFNLHLDVPALAESGRASAGDGAAKSRLNRRIAKRPRLRREATHRQPTPSGRAVAMVLPRRTSQAKCRRGHEGWDHRTCCCERHFRGNQGYGVCPEHPKTVRELCCRERGKHKRRDRERWTLDCSLIEPAQDQHSTTAAEHGCDPEQEQSLVAKPRPHVTT